MKQIIFGIALLLSGFFFVEQAFAQLNDANGGKGEDGTKGGVGGGTSSKTINRKKRNKRKWSSNRWYHRFWGLMQV